MKTRNLLIVLFLGLALAGTSHARQIDADATGNWYIADQPGHGLQIEVLNLSQAVVAWYTFDTEGNPVWLFGVGDIRGDTLRAELSRYHGTKFPPEFDGDAIEAPIWGEVIFRRTGCDTAALSYTPADGIYQPAEYPLTRLTQIDGAHCSEGPAWSQTRHWEPTESSPGFEALFLDYPDGSEDFYELAAGFSPLPEPWQDRGAMMISGNNHSDDLLMMLMRPVDGLAPNTTYQAEMEMQFATNVPDGCFGVGGSPGEGVFIRLGASTEQPGFTIVDGDRRSDIDIGQQANAGERALNAGDMTNGADPSLCGNEDTPWRLKRVSTSGQDFKVTSDDNGRIWVYGLSDSAFEATTTWYLTEFEVRLARADQ